MMEGVPMRRDHLIMAALYERAKVFDSYLPDSSPDGKKLNQATAEDLKLVCYWKQYDGKERWRVFQQAKEYVETIMAWMPDTLNRLEKREHLHAESQLMEGAEDAFNHAISLVQKAIEEVTVAPPARRELRTGGPAAETRSFSERLRQEEALKKRMIFSELYSIAMLYESESGMGEIRAATWKRLSGDGRNDVFLRCAYDIDLIWDPQPREPGGEIIEDNNAIELVEYVQDIFGRTIDTYLDQNN